MRKKFLIISALIIIFFLLIIIISYYFSKDLFKTEIEEEPEEEAIYTTQLPHLALSEDGYSELERIIPLEKVNLGSGLLFDINISNSKISNLTDELYFFVKPDGFYKYSLTNKTINLLSKPLIKKFDENSFYSIIWSPNFDQAYINYQNGGQNNLLQNFITGQETYLNRNIIAMGWFPRGESILYIYRDNLGKTTLNVAEPDGSNWNELNLNESLSDIIEEDIKYKISLSSNGLQAAIYSDFNFESIGQYDIGIIDINNNEIIKLDGSTNAKINAVWSPSGEKMIYEVLDNELRRRLWLYDSQTKKEIDLNIYSETAKITFINNDEALIAVPDKARSVYIWSIELGEEKIDPLTYSLLRVNINTLESKKLGKFVDNGGPIEVDNIYFSQKQKKLYVFNSENIYSVNF